MEFVILKVQYVIFEKHKQIILYVLDFRSVIVLKVVCAQF